MTKASDNNRSIQVNDEKESEIERRWVKNYGRESTGKLSKKTTKEGGLDTNQQRLELGLGVGVGLVIGFCQIGLRFAKKNPQTWLRCVEKSEGRCIDSEKGRNSWGLGQKAGVAGTWTKGTRAAGTWSKGTRSAGTWVKMYEWLDLCISMTQLEKLMRC